MRILPSSLLISGLLLLSALAVSIPPVHAATVLSITPKLVTGVSQGDLFSTGLTVENVNDLDGWQAKITFDPNTLAVSEARYPSPNESQFCLDTSRQSAACYDISRDPTIDNVAGSVTLSATFTIIPPQGPSGNGLLATILFEVRCALCSSILDFATADPQTSDDPTKLRSVVGTNIISISHERAPGFFTNRPDNPPFAKFKISPAAHGTVDAPVTFDASGSWDPDGSISAFRWDFGDGNLTDATIPITSHSFRNSQTFIITLTVVDNTGLDSAPTGSAYAVLPNGDFGLQASRLSLHIELGAAATSTIQVLNMQTVAFTANVTLAATVSPSVPNGPTATVIPSTIRVPGTALLTVSTASFTVEGNYTITVAGTGGGTAHFIQILASVSSEPLLTVTPSSGEVGARVQVQGSGFLPPGPETSTGIAWVSFDDMFLGFALVDNGKFTFTFSVPRAEAGAHEVKAFDPLTQTQAKASFEVLPSRAVTDTLAVILDVGSIYFPGETAQIFVMATVNGRTVPPQTLWVQLQLVKPDGVKTALTAISQGNGLYKALYRVPDTGSTGTYVLTVTVYQIFPLDSSLQTSALGVFQVKPTWVQGGGPRTATAATLVGLLAVLGVAWRKGYLRKLNDSLGLV